jgi:prepilin-type N-terminal cleavage/methylation domain-containing protein
MVSSTRRVKGFTLIELMVTLAVLLVLMLLALPSFEAVRQRAALRGAGEQALGFWNQARLESAKRNQMVKVGVRMDSTTGAFCLGAATTTSPTDNTPCNCLLAAPSTDVCDVARFPSDQAEWSRVTLNNVTLGGTTVLTNIKPAVIESKRTSLITSTRRGSITLNGPPGRKAYQLRVSVDRFGRAVLCEPTNAPFKLSDYGNRQCGP